MPRRKAWRRLNGKIYASQQDFLKASLARLAALVEGACGDFGGDLFIKIPI